MEKVKITIKGKAALVDADQVSIYEMQAMLHDMALDKAAALEFISPCAVKPYYSELQDIIDRMVELDKTLRKNVQFL